MPRKVLIVDDEVSILRSTALLLQDLGFEVVTTSEPSHVVSLALKERPDVLLQDVRMPGLDVERLVHELRAQPELVGTQIILFSAGMDTDEIAERVGVTRWIEKPFKPQEIAGILSAEG